MRWEGSVKVDDGTGQVSFWLRSSYNQVQITRGTISRENHIFYRYVASSSRVRLASTGVSTRVGSAVVSHRT